MMDDVAQEQLVETLQGERTLPPMAGALLKNEADMNLLARFTNLLRG